MILKDTKAENKNKATKQPKPLKVIRDQSTHNSDNWSTKGKLKHFSTLSVQTIPLGN